MNMSDKMQVTGHIESLLHVLVVAVQHKPVTCIIVLHDATNVHVMLLELEILYFYGSTISLLLHLNF
jgi:hypothetical protein